MEKFKISFLGLYSAGKSSFLQMLNNKSEKLEIIGTSIALNKMSVNVLGFKIDYFDFGGYKEHREAFLEKKTNCVIIVLADPCFGSCDIANYELKNIGVEFVIQIGPTSIPNLGNNFIPTVFINALSSKNISHIVKKSLAHLEGTRIGIVTTAQHIHNIDIVESILKKQNFVTIISDGDKRIYNTKA